MDKPTKREVVAALIKAGRRDLACVLASDLENKVARLLPGATVEKVFEPAPGLVHVIVKEIGSLDLDDQVRLTQQLGVKSVNLSTRQGLVPVVHNAIVRVKNSRFTPRQLKHSQMYRMEYRGGTYKFFAPRGTKLVVELRSGDVHRLQTSRGSPPAFEIVRKL